VDPKKQAFNDLDEAYKDFRQTIEGLDEERFRQKWLGGRWSVREIVAHLAGWHRELGLGLERISRGERATPEGVDWSDVEGWNRSFAEAAAHKEKEEVLRELDEAVEGFKQAGEKLPEERFQEGKTVWRLFQNAGISHFREHREGIAEWLQR
jgi:hypothetical protein